MPLDRYQGPGPSVISPSSRWEVITPDDGNDLAELPKAIHLGGDDAAPSEGEITIEGSDGVSASFWMRKGDVLPIRPKRVLATGTTAGLVIVALL